MKWFSSLQLSKELELELISNATYFPSLSDIPNQIFPFFSALYIIVLIPPVMAFMTFCLQLFIYPSSSSSRLLRNRQARAWTHSFLNSLKAVVSSPVLRTCSLGNCCCSSEGNSRQSRWGPLCSYP